jgi:hypothetical protein
MDEYTRKTTAWVIARVVERSSQRQDKARAREALTQAGGWYDKVAVNS